MRSLLTAAAIAFSSCSPGTSSVFVPDSGDGSSGDASSANASSMDASAPDGSVVRDTGPPRDAEQADTRAAPDLPPSPSRVWTAESDGTIAWWTFDPSDASLSREGVLERGGQLNFLAFSADRTKLYAINGSRVEAFDISSLPPTFLGDADAGVAATGTHLAVDSTNSHVFVAWYGGNAVSMLPLGADGAPLDATVVLGTDADPGFCQRAHQIRVHPNNQFVYVPCLGSDHIAVLAYDANAGTLEPQAPATAVGGSGPRHMDFHPALSQAFVIGELDDSITRFDLNSTSGALTQLQTISTRPNVADPLGPASDVHVSPDGDWVVGVNRNPRDEVVTFALAADGTMSDPRWVATGGEHARTFAFAPGGGHLLLGNSNSMDVTVFTFANGVATLVDTIGGFDGRVMFVGFE